MDYNSSEDEGNSGEIESFLGENDGQLSVAREEKPFLLHLIENFEYPDALTRIASHPHETAHRVASTGRTILHYLVDFSETESSLRPPPLDLTKKVIESSLSTGGAGEDAVSARDSDGRTPLALALLTYPLDVPRIASHANEMIRLLLLRDPECVSIPDKSRNTPLDHFKRVWAAAGDTQGLAARKCAIEHASCPQELNGILRSLFQLSYMLLRASVHGTPGVQNDDDSCPHFVHSALSACSGPNKNWVCPESLLRLALQVCGEQGWERDPFQYGRVPLCIAASSMPSSGCQRFGSRSRRDTFSLRRRTVHMLTESCPETSRIPDGDRRLALHLALEYGWTWDDGVDLILNDAPEALLTRDVTTGFYPFMTAAISVKGSDSAGRGKSCHCRLCILSETRTSSSNNTSCQIRNTREHGDVEADISTVYELLRRSPLLASGLAAEPPAVKSQKQRERISSLEEENLNLKKEVKDCESEMAKMRDKIALLTRRLRKCECSYCDCGGAPDHDATNTLMTNEPLGDSKRKRKS